MSRLANLIVAMLLITLIVGCSNQTDNANNRTSTAMTDPNLELTPEEQEALDRDNKVMGVLRQANQNSGTSFQELFPHAQPVSELQYWASINRPVARAKLKQAIASGADVNEKSDGDYTPLHGAAENGALENAKLLVANGADVSAKTVDGKTALDLAKAQGHTDVVAFLESQSQ